MYLTPASETEPTPTMQPVPAELRRKVESAFRSYESRLYHAALRITRNPDDAWDAVQEAMVSALRHAERFRGDAAVASWMYSIVVNAALYQRRRASGMGAAGAAACPTPRQPPPCARGATPGCARGDS